MLYYGICRTFIGDEYGLSFAEGLMEESKSDLNTLFQNLLILISMRSNLHHFHSFGCKGKNLDLKIDPM